jgi:phospholipid/cholesterol/gamma-HCH transport system ATP-binding protein
VTAPAAESVESVAPAPQEVATISGLHKAFGERKIQTGVDLGVAPGKITVVLGGSGSGKSTLLRILLGLESYDAGSVRLFGREVKSLGRDEYRDLMMQVGMLFQFGALFDSMTVGDNVGFALRYVQHLDEAEIRERCRENLLMVGLKNVEDLMPSQLSGGMRKRVALARAIAHKPGFLCVDEPTTGLDPIMSDTINELILQMRDRLGVTVLCITHDLTAAFKIADRLTYLFDGTLRFDGTPEEARACEDPVVRQFISGSAHGPIAGA